MYKEYLETKCIPKKKVFLIPFLLLKFSPPVLLPVSSYLFATDRSKCPSVTQGATDRPLGGGQVKVPEYLINLARKNTNCFHLAGTIHMLTTCYKCIRFELFITAL